MYNIIIKTIFNSVCRRHAHACMSVRMNNKKFANSRRIMYFYSFASAHTHTHTRSQFSFICAERFWLYFFFDCLQPFIVRAHTHTHDLSAIWTSVYVYLSRSLAAACVCVCHIRSVYFANLAFFFRTCDYTLLLYHIIFIFILSCSFFVRLIRSLVDVALKFVLFHLPLCIHTHRDTHEVHACLKFAITCEEQNDLFFFSGIMSRNVRVYACRDTEKWSFWHDTSHRGANCGSSCV